MNYTTGTDTRAIIAEMRAQNISKNEIARRLGCSRDNVQYHCKNIESGHTPAPKKTLAYCEGRDTTVVVGEMLAQGISKNQIARTLGCTRDNVQYHAKKLAAANTQA